MAGRNNCDANANMLDLILYVFYCIVLGKVSEEPVKRKE